MQITSKSSNAKQTQARARRAGPSALAMGAAALTLALAGRAQATTYNNPVNGAPANGVCNLSDAVRAATTNTAVHACAAGSSSGTDTINLRPGVIYQGWGTPLHVPPTGGALVIQGSQDANGNFSKIRSANFGYPTPIGGAEACEYPAAIFSGGTLTLSTLQVQANETDTTGICQYAGSVTLNGVEVGDGLLQFGFNAGGIASVAGETNPARTLTIRRAILPNGNQQPSRIIHNFTPNFGAGLFLQGNVTTNISDTLIEQNWSDESGGGLGWFGGYGKMGNLTLTRVALNNNTAQAGFGGAMYLDPDDINATATISDGNNQQNTAVYTGSGIYVGAFFGTNKLILNRAFIGNNNVGQDSQQRSLNSDPWVWGAVSCRQSSTVEAVTGSQWSSHSPPLKGDGTCIFP